MLADALGREGLPVYLYGALAGGRTRAELRRGGPDALIDARGARLRPADACTRRRAPCSSPRAPPLVAFNVELAPPATLEDARAIAALIREGGPEGLPGVRAIGVQLAHAAQVSTNVEDHRAATPADVVAAVRRHAAVAAAELVALAPEAALADFPEDVAAAQRARRSRSGSRAERGAAPRSRRGRTIEAAACGGGEQEWMTVWITVGSSRRRGPARAGPGRGRSGEAAGRRPRCRRRRSAPARPARISHVCGQLPSSAGAGSDFGAEHRRGAVTGDRPGGVAGVLAAQVLLRTRRADGRAASRACSPRRSWPGETVPARLEVGAASSALVGVRRSRRARQQARGERVAAGAGVVRRDMERTPWNGWVTGDRPAAACDRLAVR